MMKKSIIQLIAIMMVVAMLFTFTGCSDEGAESIIEGADLNYGDEVIDDLEDDGDTVTVSTVTSGSDKGNSSSGGNKGSSNKDNSNKGNGSGNKNSGGNTIDYGDKFENNYAQDEGKKTSFLESVPKNLAGQEVTILTWWQPFEHEKKKMEKFTKETGIKIKWIYADMSNYLQRLATLRAQGNPPDIACIRVDDYPNAILLDYFRPISESKIDTTKSIFDIDSMNKMKFGGKHYGVIIKGTTYITMGILAYNADMFDKNGVTSPQELWDSGKWNWESFVEIALDIQKKAKVAPLNSPYSGYRLAQTSGEDAIAFKNGKLVNNMKSEVYRSGYKWVSDLTPKGKYGILIPHGDNMYNDFLSGQVAMVATENWLLQKGERLSGGKFTIGFAPLPCKTSKTVIPSDAQLWGFPTGSKHLEAASYALEYWHNPQYIETGYDLWMSDSAAGFMDWMWKQPKSFKISQGVFNYGGEGSFWDYNFMILENPDKIDSYIDSRMSFVDANLKKIYEVAK